MLSVFSVTLPFFVLVLLGYLATRRGLLPIAAIPGLNIYVLFMALPCMLFRFGAATPIAQLLDASIFVVYLPCALLMVGITIALTLSRQTNWNNASFGALVAAFPNTGFMGIPMLAALLGAQIAGPAIITIAIDMVMTTSLCVALSRLDGTGEHGVAKALGKALMGMASNPMPWAILLGIAFSALNWELLGPAAKTVELLGVSASPVALFTIGAVLARRSVGIKSSPSSFQPNGDPQKTHKANRDEWLIAMLKLFLHPILVLLVGICAIKLGLPLGVFALKVIVLVAALPSASNVAMLAERFHADTERVARIILISTALAFFTFSGAVALLM